MGNGNSTDVGDNYNLISTIRRNSKKPYTQQEFLFVDGRRFHNENDASYVLPNDDKEVDRLQMQHYLMKHVWGSNFSSPIETKLKQHGSRVLDVGCGTGIVSLDMAHTFLNCEFIGIDISPIYPSEIKPSNVKFQKVNVIQGLPFPDNHFDFVYQRFLVMSLTPSQIEILINELLRVLKPGGWLEIMEAGIGTLNQGPAQKLLMDAVKKLVNSNNLVFGVDIYQKNFENHPGLIDVKLEKRECLLGKSGGKLGEVCRDDFSTGCEALKSKLMPILNYSDKQYDELIKEFIKEVDDKSRIDRYLNANLERHEKLCK
ncbi:96_t:CDS:2 [Entrophospora sp. SA101]|nr:96_t:CDS:2 [Entrophospora sp. SA101]